MKNNKIKGIQMKVFFSFLVVFFCSIHIYADDKTVYQTELSLVNTRIAVITEKINALEAKLNILLATSQPQEEILESEENLSDQVDEDDLASQMVQHQDVDADETEGAVEKPSFDGIEYEKNFKDSELTEQEDGDVSVDTISDEDAYGDDGYEDLEQDPLESEQENQDQFNQLTQEQQDQKQLLDKIDDQRQEAFETSQNEELEMNEETTRLIEEQSAQQLEQFKEQLEGQVLNETEMQEKLNEMNNEFEKELADIEEQKAKDLEALLEQKEEQPQEPQPQEQVVPSTPFMNEGEDPGPRGDPTIVLTWSHGGSSKAEGPDIDVWVDDPKGNRLSTSNEGVGKGPTSEGGQIDHDDLGGWGDGNGGGPERVYWPVGKAPLGKYTYGVKYYQGDGTARFTVKVYRNGMLLESKSGTLNTSGERSTLGSIQNQ